MEELRAFLTEKVVDGLLAWRWQTVAATRFGCSCGVVEDAALQLGILPARYRRNQAMLTTADQLKLFRSRVTVIGCGGLGGYIIEELARLGVGHIVAVDPDVFEEHNLNRQILSSPGNLGTSKVQAAARRVAEINPAVVLIPVKDSFSKETGEFLLKGSVVAVDALDSIPVRLELAAICNRMGIPLVHGAIGGWYGHIATQMPGDDTVAMIYRSREEGKGIEKQLGNPSFTPAVVASLEAAELCKILLGKGAPLQKRKLSIDLLAMEIHEIEL